MSIKIPSIIKQQLFDLDIQEVFCWGAHNWIGTDNTLIFNVQNCNQLSKGTVHITLNGKDLYDIKVFDLNFELIISCDDIYCDMLTDTIHNLID